MNFGSRFLFVCKRHVSWLLCKTSSFRQKSTTFLYVPFRYVVRELISRAAVFIKKSWLSELWYLIMKFNNQLTVVKDSL